MGVARSESSQAAVLYAAEAHRSVEPSCLTLDKRRSVTLVAVQSGRMTVWATRVLSLFGGVFRYAGVTLTSDVVTG